MSEIVIGGNTLNDKVIQEKKEYYSLSHPQYRIWTTEQIFRGYAVNNLGGLVFIDGDINYEKLKQMIKLLIRNNVSLNLRFSEQNTEPKQYLFYDETYNVSYKDVSMYRNPQNEMRERTKESMKKVFHIMNSNLYEFHLYKLSDSKCAIFAKFHHLICDGWSINIFSQQLEHIYEMLMDNQEVSVNSYSYLNYLHKEENYCNSKRFVSDKEFWNRKYQAIPESLQSVQNDILCESNRIMFCLTGKETKLIHQFMAENNISLNTLSIACMALYLKKTINTRDITIGIPVYNRSGKMKYSVGMFTSTVPLRLYIEKGMKLVDFISYVDKQLKECLYHSMYPYNLLIKDIKERGENCNHLYNISVNYYNTKLTHGLFGNHVTFEELQSGDLAFELQLVINEWDEENKITLSFDYRVSQFSSEKINRMYKAIHHLLCSLHKNSHKYLEDISLFSEIEQDKLLYQFNDTAAVYPKEKMIMDIIKEKMVEQPTKIALEKDGQVITYSELHQKVNSLAYHLRNKGIQRNDRVCLITSHSFETIIGILAILKAGGTYIPIDEHYPIQRIAAVIEDSHAKMILTNLDHIQADKFDIEVMNLLAYEFNKEADMLTCISAPDDIAYIIYTSGSTGKPKGVMISHRALVNYIWWAKKVYGIGNDDAFALYSSVSFDLTVTSIFTPLVAGIKMVIYDSNDSEFVLYRILRENKVTIIKLTPAHLSLLTEYEYHDSKVRVLIVGGDNLKVSLSKKIQDNFGSELLIYNEYGPTEATVGCMIHKYDVKKDTGASVPIGIPAHNVQLYILDENLKLSHYDSVGELYISGDGVAAGYVNLEQLTKDKFIQNPFIPNQVMYRTGDLCRYREDGLIEYIGRIDNQIKINGFRIELNEIEHCLTQIDGIKDAVVLTSKTKKGVNFLCAYLILSKKLDEDVIKRHLRDVMPEYMLPKAYIYMKKFPFNSNGKIDIGKFPIYEDKEEDIVVQAETQMEKVLISVVQQVLETENIGINQNYFNKGGDSIKAIQTVTRLREMGYELKVRDILTNPIIRDIAKCIKPTNEKKSINQEKEEGEIPFTPIIQWFLEEQDIINKNYWNQSVLLELDNVVSYEMIEVAITVLIQHHDILRLCFDSKENRIFYKNEYYDSVKAVFRKNLQCNSKEEIQEKLIELCEEFKSTIDLENDICFKALWIDLEQGNNQLLITANHLLVDGVSWRILIEDLTRLLMQQSRNESMNLPAKTSSYKNWAEHLKVNVANYVPKQFDFWNACDNVITSYTQQEKHHWSMLEKTMSGEVTRQILLFNAHDVRIEQDEILLIALGLALQEIYAMEEKVVIDVEGHGREEIFDDIDLTRTVGWFTIHYPVMMTLSQSDLKDRIILLKEEIRRSKKHAFEYSILKFNRKLDDNGNRKIRFNYMGNMSNGLKEDMFTLSKYKHGKEYCSSNGIGCSLEINAMIVNKKLAIQVHYNDFIISPEEAQELADTFFNKIHDVLEVTSGEKASISSPSDYEEVSLSMDEFDMLFQ